MLSQYASALLVPINQHRILQDDFIWCSGQNAENFKLDVVGIRASIGSLVRCSSTFETTSSAVGWPADSDSSVARVAAVPAPVHPGLESPREEGQYRRHEQAS